MMREANPLTQNELPGSSSTGMASHAKTPLVSIVIPCYNQARYLASAVESALAQNYPRVEVTVVDDGSTDNTAEVSDRYPDAIYLRQENQGLAASRNTGLRASQGDFLVFLDADDRLLPGAIEAGVKQLVDHPDWGFVFGRFRYIDEDGSFINEGMEEPSSQDAYASFLNGNYVSMHATVMYRRNVLEAEGGFNPSLPSCEDYDLYLRIARKHPIGRHDTFVAEYRQHDMNMSKNPGLMLKTVLGVLRSQWGYAREDEGRLSAYRAGVRAWQRYYSEAFYQQVSGSWKRGEKGRAWQLVKAWARLAPRDFIGYSIWGIKSGIDSVMKAILPRPVYRSLVTRRGRQYQPPAGRVDFGDLRRLEPIDREFGYYRGLPIDRYYIENFLQAQAGSIRGRVLEVGDDSYTRRFGGDKVTVRDILHVKPGNPIATIVADLTSADHIPSDRFDCIILTQTLHLIYDVRSAIQTVHRILKPGGVLLATFPGISQISIDEWAESWYWAFTIRAARQMFEEVFPPEHLEIEAYGNVLAATAFLNGLVAEELEKAELDYKDPQYPMLITLRAEKPGSSAGSER